MMHPLLRQAPFIRSVLREKDKSIRKARLQHANADQINSLNAMVLNTLKGNVPLSSKTLQTLVPYKKVLRELGKRKNSLKRRRELWMGQTGSGFWKGLNAVCATCMKRS